VVPLSPAERLGIAVACLGKGGSSQSGTTSSNPPSSKQRVNKLSVPLAISARVRVSWPRLSTRCIRRQSAWRHPRGSTPAPFLRSVAQP